MQVAIAVAEPDVKLQRLAQPQCLMQTEPQQHPVGAAAAARVAPTRRRLGHLGGGRLRKVSLESAAVGQDRLGANRSGRALGEDLLERRGVIARCGCRVLGHRLETNDLVDAAAGGLGHLGEIGYPATESGVHQPIGHSCGRQKATGQLLLSELAAPIPISVRVDVARQVEQRCTVRAHRETELGVERRVELGDRFGVRLVEAVLETRPVTGLQPAAVNVMVDQRHILDVLAHCGQLTRSRPCGTCRRARRR